MHVWAGILLVTLMLGLIGLVRIITLATTRLTRTIWSILWLLVTTAAGLVVYFSGLAFIAQNYAPTLTFIAEIQYGIYAIFSAYVVVFAFVLIKTKKR